jgi:hypothetical protein
MAASVLINVINGAGLDDAGEKAVVFPTFGRAPAAEAVGRGYARLRNDEIAIPAFGLERAARNPKSWRFNGDGEMKLRAWRGCVFL